MVGPSADKAADLERIKRQDGQSIAYVADTVYDVAHAKRAGVISIAYTAGYCLPDQLLAARPDVALGDLAEVIPMLRRPRYSPPIGRAR